jgi:K+-transporting ATPase KdpF subunit
MNSPLEYLLVGLVTLGVLVYLVVALLAPEKF